MSNIYLIKVLVISSEDESLIRARLPYFDDKHLFIISDINCLIPDLEYTTNFNWIIIDLDKCHEIKDSEFTKNMLAFVAKEVKIISKDFNRLNYYKDFCSVYFGWPNFIELNFFT